MVQAKELLKSISTDLSSGARELALLSIEHIKILTKSENLSDLEWYISNLKNVKPGMAPLRNISKIFHKAIKNELFDKRAILKLADNLYRRVKDSTCRICRNLTRLLSKEDKNSIMTLSRSSTVRECLLELCGQGIIRKVYILESKPLSEGIKLAEELLKNCNVVLIPDLSLLHYMDSVDLVITGADSVINQGFLNKIGTKVLALASSYKNKPFLVLVDFLKIDIDLRQSKIEEIPAFPNLKNKLASGRVPLFELTEHDFVTYYITDLGVYKGQEIQKIRNEVNDILIKVA